MKYKLNKKVKVNQKGKSKKLEIEFYTLTNFSYKDKENVDKIV